MGLPNSLLPVLATTTWRGFRTSIPDWPLEWSQYWLLNTVANVTCQWVFNHWETFAYINLQINIMNSYCGASFSWWRIIIRDKDLLGSQARLIRSWELRRRTLRSDSKQNYNTHTMTQRIKWPLEKNAGIVRGWDYWEECGSWPHHSCSTSLQAQAPKTDPHLMMQQVVS
jgi:hypothetical protein